MKSWFAYVPRRSTIGTGGCGRRYDLILDVKTTRSPLAYARAIKPGGTYATVGGSIPRLLQCVVMGPVLARLYHTRVRVVALTPNKDLAYMNELFEAGHLQPVIDGPYPLSELPEAFRHFGTGNHQGKIVITMP